MVNNFLKMKKGIKIFSTLSLASLMLVGCFGKKPFEGKWSGEIEGEKTEMELKGGKIRIDMSSGIENTTVKARVDGKYKVKEEKDGLYTLEFSDLKASIDFETEDEGMREMFEDMKAKMEEDTVKELGSNGKLRVDGDSLILYKEDGKTESGRLKKV